MHQALLIAWIVCASAAPPILAYSSFDHSTITSAQAGDDAAGTFERGKGGKKKKH